MPKTYKIGTASEAIEFEPGFRTIQILDRQGFDKHSFHLPFPYMIFVLRKERLGFTTQTMHVGFRNKPLNPLDPIEEQEILYPLFPNIIGKTFLVCCDPKIESFWRCPFVNNSGWSFERIMTRINMRFHNWKEMSFQEVLTKCEEWPEMVRDEIGEDGYGRMSPREIPAKISIGSILTTQISINMQKHIENLRVSMAFYGE